MPTSIMDSFQLIVALYLFYIAIKGTGQMYRFGDMDEEAQALVRKRLRICYTISGFIALADFGVCCLQSSMFTRTVGEDGVPIVQNFTIDALPFLSYKMLTTASSVLIALLLGMLVFIIVWVRRKTR